MALPPHARQSFGNAAQLPVLMESGTYAVDPDPRWAGGIAGEIVIAPGDVRGTRLGSGPDDGYCCGLDGRDGPNMTCAACGLPVATRIDDCTLWQAVWLVPDAVRRVPTPVDDAEPLTWEQAMAASSPVPPCEPVTDWGGKYGNSYSWTWSPRWEAAAGQALAHLLAASEGRPVTVPEGLAAEVLQRDLDALLPVGPTARRAAPAGPGRPVPDADILLVPAHPQTGEPWSPRQPGPQYRVPLPVGVWLSLVSPSPQDVPDPVSGTLPPLVRCDYPLLPSPCGLFLVDWRAFQRTAARLPAAATPWFRENLAQRAPHLSLGPV
ncbi:hypothetical protein ACFW9D_16065 [Streptomyces sp. NPDC059524]|uniref:hypothetical protein n=1 Tax=Streptomyces sp. NPDC059524 TaxID=3346856 RepID=UPI0036B50070